MVIILMGVSGSGKTTIGQLLAGELGWEFYDGDDFHPQANVDKMRQGIALTDDDRDAWLTALQRLIQELLRDRHSAVVACSALKQAYRDRLQAGALEVRFVYLKGSYELIHQRLRGRSHFMPPSLLRSQFDALEEPYGALEVSIDDTPEAIVARIKHALRPATP